MKFALTAFGAVTVLGMQAVAGTNLLSNPSFETQGPGVIPFAGWTHQFFGNVEYSDAEITALDGDAVCKTYGIFAGPGTQGDTGLIQRVPVTEGQNYTASINTFVSSADPLGPDNLVLLLVQWQDSSGTNISEMGVTVADTFDGNTVPTDEWIEHTVSGAAPTGAAFGDFFLLFLQFENEPGSVFWDVASFVEGDAPPQPCNEADIAEPFGILDLNDITAFVEAFTAGCD